MLDTLRLGSFVWELALWSFRFGTFTLKLALGNFRLETLAWERFGEPSLEDFRSDEFVWDL